MTYLPNVSKDKTSSYALSNLDCITNKTFTNNGAITDVTFTLPPAKKGMNLTFKKVSDGGDVYKNTAFDGFYGNLPPERKVNPPWLFFLREG